MLATAKAKTTKKSVIDIYERVVKEFNIATDKEYILLRDQIFKGQGVLWGSLIG